MNDSKDDNKTIKLTLDEFNHLTNSKGNCNCVLCKQFKGKIKEYSDYIEQIKKDRQEVI